MMWRLLSSLWHLLSGTSARSSPQQRPGRRMASRAQTSEPFAQPGEPAVADFPPDALAAPSTAAPLRWRPKSAQQAARLTPLRYRRTHSTAAEHAPEVVPRSPYRFAHLYVVAPGQYLDLSQDLRPARLARWDLPVLAIPQDLATWLQLPLGKVAWLTDRFFESGRPVDASRSHYRYHWKEKKRGGFRLIEAPLPTLRQVQEQILDDILAKVPLHPAAHGFCPGRSIVTNAQPHLGQAVVVKWDLDNFYARVRYSRVVALYRGLGYSREIAVWLAKLTTSAVPSNLQFPGGEPKLLRLFLPRHLPQGAPTSPALANLVAFSLDVRLAGLAKTFGANYTRYGDDLTFSGDRKFLSSLRLFTPLVGQIIRQERFRAQPDKRRVLRRSTRQTVTGVVVNDRPNVSRHQYDQLKAILHNCLKTGPEAQNQGQHADFPAHLRGRIAFVQQLNPHKGNKLLAIYQQIAWPRSE